MAAVETGFSTSVVVGVAAAVAVVSSSILILRVLSFVMVASLDGCLKGQFGARHLGSKRQIVSLGTNFGMTLPGNG